MRFRTAHRRGNAKVSAGRRLADALRFPSPERLAMLRSLWLRNVLGLTSSRTQRRRQSAQRRGKARLMLETLEDRINPTNPVVLNAANIADLQNDLNNATASNTQYIINLTGPSSAYQLAAGQELTVPPDGGGSNVTIAGTGQSITGNGNRVVYVNAGANVTFKDVTLTGGTIQGASLGLDQG